MQCVYVGRTPPDAHLVKGFLEAAGIAALVQGEALFGLRGHVPMTPETEPSVWVAEADYEQAQALVRQFLHAGLQHAGATLWRCPRCGEYHEPQFTDCWQCGASRIRPEPE